MHSKPGFMHRLGAQSFRFLQLHPQVHHLAVVVVVPQQLQLFVDGVVWLSLEELSQQADLDPWLTLLTLPVQPEAELKRSTQQILGPRPDLLETGVFILVERFPFSLAKTSWRSPPSRPKTCATPEPPRSGSPRAKPLSPSACSISAAVP